jgi:hypothetical protein
VKVKISENISFDYMQGEWHILHTKQVKGGTTKEKVDYHGNLNRCIASLPAYSLGGSDAYKHLYTSYKNALTELLSIKTLELSNLEYHSELGQVFLVYPDPSKTNILIDYSYSTEHGMSETGIKKSKQYLTNHYQVATFILDIEVGERLIKLGDNQDSGKIIEIIEEVKNSLLEVFSEKTS